MKKYIFTLFFTLFVASGVWAYTFEVDGIYYNIIDGGVEVTEKYYQTATYTGDITIPSVVSYNGSTYSVTSIGLQAFSDCTGLTTITLPESLTTIGAEAFFRCTGLTSIILPNSVTTIENYAFSGCTGLTSIIIPKNVISIEESIFFKCENLSSIKVDEGNPMYDSRNNCNAIIEKYSNMLIAGCKNTIIPENVAAIGEGAFNGCSGLTSIIIPNSVIMIGEYAFADCTGLTSIILPNRITSIGKGAFCGCSSLTSITLPNRVTSIEKYIFYGCEGLTSLTLPNSVNTINAFVFAECTNLTSVICLAEIPPIISDQACNCGGDEDCYKECYRNPFNTGGQNIVTVYVPSDASAFYKLASDWRNSPVDIQPIPAENVTISKDEVDVKVEKATADFYMPINASADSYTLTIKNNGVTFCTLTFNAQGQLANIDFSTTKSYELKADVSAFKFTVTGLSEATDYGYSFKALSSSKSVLKEYTGSFTTKNADGTGGSSQGGAEVEGGAGQGGEGGEQGGSTAINGVSNATAVTIANNQIFVNGEAPAFVVTISGQKIANQNLKSGVYFVNVEGETVKVSVQ